jgi:hypothetical protein
VDVAVHGAAGFGLAGEAGNSIPSMTAVIVPRTGLGLAGGRGLPVGGAVFSSYAFMSQARTSSSTSLGVVSGIRTVAWPRSLAGWIRPSGCVVSSRWPRSTRDFVVGLSTAKVRRGETSETSVPRPDGDRPGKRGQGCEHRVEDWPQLRPVSVLLADEIFGVGDKETGVAEFELAGEFRLVDRAVAAADEGPVPVAGQRRHPGLVVEVGVEERF